MGAHHVLKIIDGDIYTLDGAQPERSAHKEVPEEEDIEISMASTLPTGFLTTTGMVTSPLGGASGGRRQTSQRIYQKRRSKI
jgi:hypothetical protein